MLPSIAWADYQKYMTDLSSNYGVYATDRELPALACGILEELSEVQEAVLKCEMSPGEFDFQTLIGVEIGDTLCYMMILASRFGLEADQIIEASCAYNSTLDLAFINALKIGGLFKRCFRGDYLRKDDFSFKALNSLYLQDTFRANLTQSLGAVFYYLNEVALEYSISLETVKNSNMAKVAYLASKTHGGSHYSGA